MLHADGVVVKRRAVLRRRVVRRDNDAAAIALAGGRASRARRGRAGRVAGGAGRPRQAGVAQRGGVEQLAKLRDVGCDGGADIDLDVGARGAGSGQRRLGVEHAERRLDGAARTNRRDSDGQRGAAERRQAAERERPAGRRGCIAIRRVDRHALEQRVGRQRVGEHHIVGGRQRHLAEHDGVCAKGGDGERAGEDFAGARGAAGDSNLHAERILAGAVEVQRAGQGSYGTIPDVDAILTRRRLVFEQHAVVGGERHAIDRGARCRDVDVHRAGDADRRVGRHKLPRKIVGAERKRAVIVGLVDPAGVGRAGQHPHPIILRALGGGIEVSDTGERTNSGERVEYGDLIDPVLAGGALVLEQDTIAESHGDAVDGHRGERAGRGHPHRRLVGDGSRDVVGVLQPIGEGIAAVVRDGAGDSLAQISDLWLDDDDGRVVGQCRYIAAARRIVVGVGRADVRIASVDQAIAIGIAVEPDVASRAVAVGIDEQRQIVGEQRASLVGGDVLDDGIELDDDELRVGIVIRVD